MKPFIFGLLLIVLISTIWNTQPDYSLKVINFGNVQTAVTTKLTSVTKQHKPPTAKLVEAVANFDSLIFVGDVLLGRNVEYLMATKGCAYPYSGIDFKEYALTPAVIGNFEAVIPQVHIPTPIKQLRFSVPDTCIKETRNFGFTHFSLANNHSLDFGDAGIKNTVKSLRQQNIKSFGFVGTSSLASVSYIQTKEIRVAIVGFETLSSLYTVEMMQNVLALASQKSDRQVVYIHWGIEYETTSSKEQRQIAKKLIAAGADIIIGHHPHVVQEIGLIDGVPVFYSLGNFIFDQYFSKEVKQGLTVQVDFTENAVHLLPVTAAKTVSQPTHMMPEDHYHFLDELAKKSAPELKAQIQRGTLHFESSVASSPKIAMIGTINW